MLEIGGKAEGLCALCLRADPLHIADLQRGCWGDAIVGVQSASRQSARPRRRTKNTEVGSRRVASPAMAGPQSGKRSSERGR